jgi:cell division protein FtsA
VSGSLIAGLDIGTSKVCCATAEMDENGNASITGAGQASVEGCLREGVLLDVAGVAAAIEKAVSDAELLCSATIQSVFAGVSGAHVRGFSGTGTVSVGRQDESETREITLDDVRRAEEAARAVGLPPGCRVLETIRRDYSVDGFDRLRKPPVGLRAEQLTASIYTVIADRTAVHNLEAAIDAAGLETAGVFPSAMASGASVLTRDEMEMGVAIADIGAGTTDVAVYRNGFPAHAGVVPLGGDNITHDLQALRIPLEQAESIKTGWAVASAGMVDPNLSRKVPMLGNRSVFTVSHSVVSQVVGQRVEEIFEGVLAELLKAGVELVDLPAGLVITGGSSRLQGLADVAGRVTGLAVQHGVPSGLETSTGMVLTPEFATCIGLIQLARETVEEARNRRGKGLSGLFRRLTGAAGKLR